MNGLRITVDPVACEAYGYCAEILPEAIFLDEWGYPIVDNRSLPPALLELAKRTARDCPKRAITVRRQRRSSNQARPL
jgi:ferredoxin